MDILPFTQQQQRLVPSTLPSLIRRLGEELRCPICLDTLKSPYSGSSCSHSYCHNCLQQMLRSSKTTKVPCPMCKVAPISRREIKIQPKINEIIIAFDRLASAYKIETGLEWDEDGIVVEDSYDDDDIFSSLNSTPIKSLKKIDETPFKTPITVKFDYETPIKFNAIARKSPKTQISKSQIEQLQMDQRNLSQKIRHINTLLTNDDFEFPTIDFPSSLPDRLFSLPLTQTQTPKFSSSLLKKDSPEMKQLTFFCNRANIPLVNDPSTSTHFITLRSLTNPKIVKKRTINYCRAVLGGAWILPIEWVYDQFNTNENTWGGNEKEYSLLGDPYTIGPILSDGLQMNSIFSGLNFFLYGAHLSPSYMDLSLLLVEGGGTCLSSSDDLSFYKKKSIIILCDGAVNNSFEKDVSVLQKYRPFISSIWILDSISERRLVDRCGGNSEYIIL